MTRSAENSLESIPFDLIIEILLRLPGKSLLKFKLVSKTWCSIIHNQYFIDRLMSISMSRPRLIFVFRRHHNEKKHLLFFSSAHHFQESNDSSSMAIKHDMTMSEASKVHGNSVRGLICCSRDTKYMVCNPTTRQVIHLPEDDRFDFSKRPCDMYLGYDSRNDKYKVLRMITQPGNFIFYEQSIFSFGCKQSSSFSWRLVENGISKHVPSNDIDSVYIDGVVYFEAWENPELRHIMVSFDFVFERFDLIKLPDKRLDRLANYQGKLGGIRYLENDSCILWVLDDVKNQIWSKMTVVSPPYFFRQTHSFPGTNVGELAFVPEFVSNDLYVFFYDLKKNVTRRVKIEGVINDKDIKFSGRHLCYLLMSCNHVDNISRML